MIQLNLVTGHIFGVVKHLLVNQVRVVSGAIRESCRKVLLERRRIHMLLVNHLLLNLLAFLDVLQVAIQIVDGAAADANDGSRRLAIIYIFGEGLASIIYASH